MSSSPGKSERRSVVAVIIMMALLAVAVLVGGAAVIRLSAGGAGRSTAATPAASPPDAAGADDQTPNAECVQVEAGANIQKLIDGNPRRASFCVGAGVHRLSSPLTPRDRQKFIGTAGAILNGSKVITDWAGAGGVWSSAGHRQGPTRVAWSGSTIKFREALLADDVFYDGALLRRVTSRADVAPGAFFFDYEKDTIYIGDDPTGHTVELATAESIFTGTATNVVIQGLVIEKSRGRGVVTGEGWVIEGSEIRLNATQGVRLNSRSVVRGNNLHHNGQYGISGVGVFLRVENNEIAFNNTHRFYIASGGNWASGGTKFVQTGDPKLGRDSGIVIKGNNSHHNFGDGIWLDIDNIFATVEGNMSTDNERRGINYEISYQGVIAHNVVRANGEAGIRITSSPDVEVFQNTVMGNGFGIVVTDEPRGRGKYGPHRSRGNSIHDNVEEGNGASS